MKCFQAPLNFLVFLDQVSGIDEVVQSWEWVVVQEYYERTNKVSLIVNWSSQFFYPSIQIPLLDSQRKLVR